MSHPVVSVLIPCCNAEAWLAETLESVLAQTWAELEVIVVDDGSVDGSLRVARQFESRAVRVCPQPNSGASAARNRALRTSRGEYIQFLDADDLLSPHKIEAQVRLLASRGPGAVATCAWGRFSGRPADARFVDDAVFRDFHPLDFLVLAADTGAMMHPAAWLVPRPVVERAGPWNESLSLNDDGEYFSRVALAASSIAFCGDPRAKTFYRSALPGSLSQRRSEASLRSQFHAIELITAHLRQAEDSARTRRATANAFLRFVHDYHPAPAELERKAEAIAAEFGATLGAPAMGPKTAALARLIGWKAVARLKQRLRP